MARQKAFAPGTIDALNCVRIYDPQIPGLQIEALPCGKRRWQYRRRLPRSPIVIKLILGAYPAHSIADAREWATDLNAKVEAGIDPRDVLRVEQSRTTMTVARASPAHPTAILTDALGRWLERKGSQEFDQRFGTRLDRQNRLSERIERKLDAVTELIGVFVQYQMTLVAHQPTFDDATARLGREHYNQLIDLAERRNTKGGLAQRIGSGHHGGGGQ